MFKLFATIAFLVSLVITMYAHYRGLDWHWDAFWTLLLAITTQRTEE